MKRISKQHFGFSLIELMVALTIFSIVMTVAMGTLIVLIDANAKAQAVTSSMTNLTFAIDSMTRNLRTGRNFYCISAGAGSLTSGMLPGNTYTADCSPSGNTAIVFTPGFESNWRMAYRLNSTSNAIEQRIDRGTQGSWVPITSNATTTGVTIGTLKFIVQGSDDYLVDDDDDQPRIVLLIAGTVDNGLDEETDFQVQSNVIQRVLNY
jgi:prepilin-type N-terminal cleavage/methylation domain-containing protein